MKCYLKPEVYERLAMEYSLGTLQGRARLRFEKLMEQHTYIQATVDDIDRKLATLSERLPEVQPPAQVWKKIRSSIVAEQQQSTEVEPKAGWFDSLFGNRFVLASVMAAILGLLVLFSLQPGGEHKPGAMMVKATLASVTEVPMGEVVAMKSEMKMRISLHEKVDVPEGKVLTFWCMPKDPSKPPMNMGTLLADGMTEMELTKALWEGLMEANEFIVSFEPEETPNYSPSENIKFKGKIEAITRV